ncbi:MAG: glycerol-3-phosphate dehydrogenase/oxidase [Chloroflexota bacterium]
MTSAPHTASRPPLAARGADLEQLGRETWDVLIVGGGIVGTGALLDAASRGLRAALIEQDDVAVGTSSRSSRLIHGGLRYLEQFHVGLVREALHERARLLELAPHLVRLERFLFPLYGTPVVTRSFFQSGMVLYDLLGSAKRGGRHHHLSVDGALELAPNLRREGLQGAMLYADGMEDDARFTLAVLRTAQREGGLAVTRVKAVKALRDGDRVAGATVRDELTGTEFDVRAAMVLDATGVWGSKPDRPFDSGKATFNVLPSRGSHILVERDRIPVKTGVTIRVPGKVAFMVPWPRHWVIGTTDDPFTGPVDRPSASSPEIDKILAAVNSAFDVSLTRDDIVGTYAGLRPLIAPSGASSTVKVSREHKVAVEDRGLVRISGGKYTTYRLMARDAIDAVLGDDAKERPSATAEMPLVGGAVPRAELDALAQKLAGEAGLDADRALSLVDRHGTEATAVLALGRERDLVRPLVAGHPYIEAEVAWAAEHEIAMSLDDILARRLRLAMTLRDRGEAIAPRVASIAGEVLGWDADRQAREVAAYVAGAHREFDVPA